ncbi:MAG: hypothetical protein WC570_02805 [Patescibacteria group bacterium]
MADAPIEKPKGAPHLASSTKKPTENGGSSESGPEFLPSGLGTGIEKPAEIVEKQIENFSVIPTKKEGGLELPTDEKALVSDKGTTSIKIKAAKEKKTVSIKKYSREDLARSLYVIASVMGYYPATQILFELINGIKTTEEIQEKIVSNTPSKND